MINYYIAIYLYVEVKWDGWVLEREGEMDVPWINWWFIINFDCSQSNRAYWVKDLGALAVGGSSNLNYCRKSSLFYGLLYVLSLWPFTRILNLTRSIVDNYTTPLSYTIYISYGHNHLVWKFPFGVDVGMNVDDTTLGEYYGNNWYVTFMTVFVIDVKIVVSLSRLTK